MTKIILAGNSNWETIAFILINRVVGRNSLFNRMQLIKNIDTVVSLSALLGHKKNPDHPEETLQRTLQNMRDKGFIDFLGAGEYKLTPAGHKRMKHAIETIQSVFKENDDFNKDNH